MGATLIIYESKEVSEKDSLWMPNSRDYTRTLLAAAAELQDTDPKLAAEIKQAAEDALPYWNLTDWDAIKLNILLDGITRLEQKLSHDLAWVGGRLSLLRTNELRVLLYLDDRCAKDKCYLAEGAVILNDDLQWQRTGWVYDFVVAALMNTAARDHQQIAMMLYQARKAGEFDLRPLTTQDRQDLMTSFDTVKLIYGQNQSGAAYSKAFQSVIKPAVIELYQGYREANPEIVAWGDAE